MAFCISTNGLPRIHDYKDAEYVYGTIKPIRRRGREHIRPLAERRDHNKRIECNTDRNGRPYYAAILHHTEVVSYYEDGTIRLKNGGWTTMSTAEFINAVSPWRCWRQYGFLNIRVNGGDYAVSDDYEGTLIKDGIVLNPVPLAVNKYNRAETKRIRELAKPVLDYFRTMRKVIGEENVRKACWEMRKGYDGPIKSSSQMVATILLRLDKGEEVGPQMLADTFAWCAGELSLDYLYRLALNTHITTSHKLYITTHLPPGTIKEGMIIHKETA